MNSAGCVIPHCALLSVMWGWITGGELNRSYWWKYRLYSLQESCSPPVLLQFTLSSTASAQRFVFLSIPLSILVLLTVAILKGTCICEGVLSQGTTGLQLPKDE